VTTVLAGSDWRSRARCVGADPRIFDGERKWTNGPLDFSEAREVCAGCTVRQSCLDDAIDNEEQECMRGGMTPTEYRRLMDSPVGLTRRKRAGERVYVDRRQREPQTGHRHQAVR
jgi:WhiB family transcriptional regulator, redox-sensing transcriptional regulator